MLKLVLLATFVAASPSPHQLPTSQSGWQIVEGNDVSPPGKYPWQCSMQSRNYHHCGCSFIGRRWVVTAAHCLNVHDETSLSVIVGAHDILSLTQGSPERIDVERTIKHEDYNNGPALFSNDIALLLLASQPKDSEFLKAIAVAPNDNHTYIADECYITGWGLTDDSPDLHFPDILQEADMDVISKKDCEAVLGAPHINDHVICLLDTEDKASTAFITDSGGPLQCKRDGEFVLAGVCSWGRGAVATFPTVYTRVSAYHDWIINNTNNLS